MQLSRLFMISVLFGSALAACGDSGGGGGTHPDAPKAIDAAIDAPTTLAGIGQRCVPAMGGADCPAEAPGCIGSGATGYCTALCLQNGTMMTDAQAKISAITPDPTAAAQQGKCTAAFHGTTGTTACATIVTSGNCTPAMQGCLTYQPPDNPLMASKTYTNVNLACLVVCGAGNTCPGTLTPTVAGTTCTCK